MSFRRLIPAVSAGLLLTLVLLPQDQKPSDAKKKKGLPLKPERKVEFTTDEGTWLSLDVAPNGRQIIFELLGDIYTLPIEGGEARPLLTGMAFDSQPRYSPDGNKIAFLSDREGAENLWIANADGSDPKPLSKEQHTDFASPAWTPDGEYVLVSRASPASRTNEIWMYSVRGGSGVQVTKALSGPAAAAPPSPTTPRMNALGAVASPDGRFFYYARRTGMFTYNATFPLWQIVRRDRITGDEDVLTQEYGSAFRPLLSPDGKKLVYGTRLDAQTGLRIRNLDTGEDHMLKYPVQRDDQESIASRDLLPGYAFLPDGRDLVLNYGGRIHRLSVATGEDSVIPFTAKVSQDLGPRLYFPTRAEEGPVKVRLIQGPEQSPDGGRLAFSALTHLYVSDGPRNPHRITTGADGEYLPAWSPDGQWIAYVTWSPRGGQIWKMRANGQGAPEQLTRAAAFYRDPVWSPDGSRIVALRAATRARLGAATEFGSPPGMDVIWLPSAGGDAQLIAPARGVGGPHFGPEPDRVYFYSGQAGLLSMRYDGTDRRALVKVVGKSPGPEPAPASDVRIGPKGDLALALVFNQLYLLAVPRVGGDPPTINVNTASVPVKKLTDVGADYFNWTRDGQTVTWALGSSFFRQRLSTVTFDPEKKPKEEGDEDKAEAAEDKKPETKSPAEEIAIDIEAPRHKPRGTVVLRGAQVITMKGDEVLPNADIVIADNRIAAVGRKGAVALPKDARVIDLKGHTIMPGIVDVHAHWMEVRRRVLDTQNWPFLANLAYGVTTGRDPQTGTNDMFAYQDLVDTGALLGPRAYSTGPGVFSATDFQSAAEARHVVRKYKKYYRTNTLKSYVVGNRKQRQWMIEACKEMGIMPTTEGKLDLKLDLTHAVDGFEGNEHSLPIVPLYKDVVEMFAKSEIRYTPTLLVAYGGPWAENYFYETTEVHDNPKLRRFIPHEVLDQKSQRRPWFRSQEQVYPKLAEAAARIARAGGHVQVGGHGQIQGIQCHWEMWALASGGLTPHEVLRIATWNGAEAIGLAQDLGSIEPGKLADLIVLQKDPLQDIHNTTSIRYVMKNGELFDGDTLDQVWPQQKKLPSMWWRE